MPCCASISTGLPLSCSAAAPACAWAWTGTASATTRLAAVEHAEALGLERAEGALAFDRIVALGAALAEEDAGAVGGELDAAVVEDVHLAEEVENLRLLQVDAGVGGERDPGAGRQRD